MDEKGLNHLIETTDFPTGTVEIELNDAGVPSYDICKNIAWDNIPFTGDAKNLAKKTKTVCFGR